jgi:hypothetical protein
VIAKYARIAPASNPPPNSSEPSIRAKAQNLLRLQQKAAERRYIFGKYNGYVAACETVAKGTEKPNNLAGNLTGWRASHRPAAAHR